MNTTYTFNEDVSDTVAAVLVAISCVTYSSFILFFLCSSDKFNKYCDSSINELTGKSDEQEFVPVDKNECLISNVSHPLLKEVLDDLKNSYSFGIQAYEGGPFIELTNLNLTNGVLHCVKDGERKSVQKIIECVKRTTRPRWIKHLCFKNEERVVMFKEYLERNHNVILKGATL